MTLASGCFIALLWGPIVDLPQDVVDTQNAQLFSQSTVQLQCISRLVQRTHAVRMIFFKTLVFADKGGAVMLDQA